MTESRAKSTTATRSRCSDALAGALDESKLLALESHDWEIAETLGLYTEEGLIEAANTLEQYLEALANAQASLSQSGENSDRRAGVD